MIHRKHIVLDPNRSCHPIVEANLVEEVPDIYDEYSEKLTATMKVELLRNFVKPWRY